MRQNTSVNECIKIWWSRAAICLLLLFNIISFQKSNKEPINDNKIVQKIQNHNKNDPGPQINQVGPGTLDSYLISLQIIVTFLPRSH